METRDESTEQVVDERAVFAALLEREDERRPRRTALPVIAAAWERKVAEARERWRQNREDGVA